MLVMNFHGKKGTLSLKPRKLKRCLKKRTASDIEPMCSTWQGGGTIR